MESSSALRRELAEQSAAAKTLDLDLQAQRDVSFIWIDEPNVTIPAEFEFDNLDCEKFLTFIQGGPQ